MPVLISQENNENLDGVATKATLTVEKRRTIQKFDNVQIKIQQVPMYMANAFLYTIKQHHTM